MTTVICSNPDPHPPHWHTVGDGTHVWAQGQCPGQPEDGQ